MAEWNRRAVPQIGHDDLGARIPLLQEPSGLHRRLAHVAMGAHHPIQLDLEHGGSGGGHLIGLGQPDT
jgi:hypothetical protein